MAKTVKLKRRSRDGTKGYFEGWNSAIKAAADQVPTTWLDSMLTGPTNVIGNGKNEIESVCLAIRDRIMRLTINR